MKTVSIGHSRQAKCIKVEFPGGTVAITTGLSNTKRESVAAVAVYADSDRFPGTPQTWIHQGYSNARGVCVRIIEQAHNKVPYGQCPICHHHGDDCTGNPAVVELYDER